jgi:ubiquinone/menaquinone biosynthesis C-methylase UbiE
MGIEKEIGELGKLWKGFWSSRVVLTANNLRVFDYLERPITAEEVARLIKADTRAIEILLNALTSLKFLRKTSGKFRNSDVAKRLLMKESPYYQGDIIRHADTLWQNWSLLDDVVRTGIPARKAHDHQSFIRGMHDNAVLRAAKVIAQINLKEAKNALDLGGGPGTYSIEFARKGISVTLFDLPETIPISREIVQRAGMDGIAFKAGDFFADDIGHGYDLIFISQVLHSFSTEDNLFIVKKCREALQTGGKIVIYEFLIADSLATPEHSALFSVNMLVNTGGGRCYSPREIIGWLSEAGFRKLSRKVFEDKVFISGRKP